LNFFYGSSVGISIWTGSFAAIVVPIILLKRLIPEKKQRKEGCVFITGCDSGMGEATALHLSGIGFRVYAGILLDESAEKLKEQATKLHSTDKNLIPVQIDVTKEESIKKALSTVKDHMQKNKGIGLVAIINCAGIATIGPFEYLPIADFRRTLEVNLIGYIATTQAFMPLLRETVEQPKSRRGRIIFIGTGGGVPSPSPPLLAPYMASKWGIEAFCQSLRIEMKLKKRRIDCCMINPGFTKPTGLYSVGMAYAEKCWNFMPPQAKEEYAPLVNAFIEFGLTQPGTHVSHVAFAMEKALVVEEPSLRYCIGFDSAISPIVGLLPTNLREWLLIKSMFSKVKEN